MTRRAWYLDVTAEQVADRAILVGDPGRVDLFAEVLDDARTLGGERALRTVTGTCRDVRITVCSFGMGAPIAAIVLEELSWLGVRTVLRAGTVMSLGDVPMGSLVLAAETISGESTSSLYGADEVALPDAALLAHARAVLEGGGEPYRIGPVASLDGFYTDLVALRPDAEAQVAARAASLRERGVIATDMESSAVLAVSRALGMRAGSLCLCSVDGPSRRRLPLEPRRAAERRLVTTSLNILASFMQEES
jgi:uridine phosphorylase